MVSIDAVPRETLCASPPRRRDLAVVEPLGALRAVLSRQVLEMVVPVVVSTVVHSVEGVAVSPALGIITVVLFLLCVGTVLVFPVPLKVRLALEGFGITSMVATAVKS